MSPVPAHCPPNGGTPLYSSFHITLHFPSHHTTPHCTLPLTQHYPSLNTTLNSILPYTQHYPLLQTPHYPKLYATHHFTLPYLHTTQHSAPTSTTLHSTLTFNTLSLHTITHSLLPYTPYYASLKTLPSLPFPPHYPSTLAEALRAHQYNMRKTTTKMFRNTQDVFDCTMAVIINYHPLRQQQDKDKQDSSTQDPNNGHYTLYTIHYTLYTLILYPY